MKDYPLTEIHNVLNEIRIVLKEGFDKTNKQLEEMNISIESLDFGVDPVVDAIKMLREDTTQDLLDIRDAIQNKNK